MINAKAIFISDNDQSHIGYVLSRITTVPEPVTHSRSTYRNKDHFLCLVFFSPGYLFESFKLYNHSWSIEFPCYFWSLSFHNWSGKWMGALVKLIQSAFSLQQAQVSEGHAQHSGPQAKVSLSATELCSNVPFNTPQASPHILSWKKRGGEK